MISKATTNQLLLVKKIALGVFVFLFSCKMCECACVSFRFCFVVVVVFGVFGGYFLYFIFWKIFLL